MLLNSLSLVIADTELKRKGQQFRVWLLRLDQIQGGAECGVLEDINAPLANPLAEPATRVRVLDLVRFLAGAIPLCAGILGCKRR